MDGGGTMEASDKTRINKNNGYYDLHVQKVRQRTEAREYQYLLDRFMALLPSDSCIIDIGCGTGENLAYFQHKSYPALGGDQANSTSDRRYMERFIQLYEEGYLDGVMNRMGFERKLKLVEESYWGQRTDWISYLLVKS
jgi:hypothetical protein